MFQETGSWILRDGPLSFSTFSKLLHDSPCSGTGPIDLAVSVLGDWNVNNTSRLVSGSRVRILCSPAGGAEKADDDVQKFVEEISRQLEPGSAAANLVATDLIGYMSFTRPTMYIFSGGHGSSFLFGAVDFNILVDGGFGQHCCFWPLARHFETIDAVLLTCLSEENVLGIATFLERKILEDVHPRIGAVLVNAPCPAKDTGRSVKAPDSGDELCVSLAEETVTIMERLSKLNIQPCRCLVSSQGSNRINLLHKYARCSLDLYIMSPVEDSREWREFADQKCSLSAAAGQISVCAAIVFQPASAGARPTRVLFCGSCTQSKIFGGCDRLKLLQLFQTQSGLPEGRPVRPRSSVSSQEMTLAVTTLKPRAPSIGSAPSSGRASEAKKFAVREPASAAVSSGDEPTAVKTVSKELPKLTQPVDVSKKPLKKPPYVKPQSFAKEIRQPVAGRDGSRSSLGVKGSTSTGASRSASAKPSVTKSEAAVGAKPVMSIKGKKPDTGGKPKMLAKRSSEPQATVAKAAAEHRDTEKAAEKEEGIMTAESDVAEPRLEVSAATAEQQVTASDTTMAESLYVKLLAEKGAESSVKPEPFYAAAATEPAEPSGVSVEVSVSKPAPAVDVDEININDAELSAEKNAPLLQDIESAADSEPFDATSGAELTKPAEVGAQVSVSKKELEVDVREKDVDTAEAGLDIVAGDVVSEVLSGVSEDMTDIKPAADGNVLPLAADPPAVINKVEDGVIDGDGMEQASTDGNDDTATHTAADQRDETVAGPVAVGSSDAESTSVDVSGGDGTEQTCADGTATYATPDRPDNLQLNHKDAAPEVGSSDNASSLSTKLAGLLEKVCAASDDEAHASDTSGQKYTEPLESTLPASDDGESKSGEFGIETVYVKSHVGQATSTDAQQDVAASVDVSVQDPADTDEYDVQDAEKDVPVLAEDDSEMTMNDASSDGKPVEEVSRDNTIGEGSNAETSASDLVHDGSLQSNVLQAGAAADGKLFGEGLPVNGLSEFDPQSDWEAPQSVPSPVKDGKEEKSSTSATAAAAAKKPTGAFKVPAPKPKTAATHRADPGVSDSVASSRSADGRTGGRLSLQPGEIKPPSPVGLRKPPAKPIVPPFYVDLVSLPVSPRGTCSVDVDFFRRIRARYYVVNSAVPDPRVLELLAEAKPTWESPAVPVTVIPTGNPILLSEWCSTHRDQMAALQISVSVAASQCVVELQGSSCRAYRLEF